MIINLFVGLFITLIWSIPVLIVVAIIIGLIFLIKTRLISKTFKIIIIAIILLCAFIMLYNYKNETIDNLYIEMKEMVDNKSLIGLSKEEVVELLGEPRYKYTDRENKENYTYSAGKIFKEWFWGRCYSTKYYQLEMDFDERGKVEYVYIKEST